MLAMQPCLQAQGKFDDLTALVPTSANSVVAIDVKAVHASPIAVRDKWADKHEAAYVNKPIMLPPESDRIVLASQMNPDEQLAQSWELGLMSLTEALSIKTIARAEGGYVDPIGGKQAAWTPSDAYFVDLGGSKLAAMYPANRQSIGNWIGDVDAKRTGLASDYLKATVASVTGPCQIAMGLDLKNVVRPHKLREKLAASEWVKGDAAKQKQWEELFLGLQGVNLKVMLTDTAKGVIQIDFAGDPSVLGKDAKSVFLTVLDDFGVGIDELGDWKVAVGKTNVTFSGDLNDSAMRKIFSLLELPSTKFSDVDAAQADAASSADVMKQASLDYFKSVNVLLDDMRNEFMTNRDARHNMAASYLDRYARRIDRLPILNVDEELLNFGATAAATMRDVSVTTKSQGVSAGVRKSAVYGNYQYSYDGYGYYDYRSNASVKTQISREEEQIALNARFTSWKQVEDSWAQIRKAMTQKYGVEF
jgi:hypothetical protein